MNKHLLAIACTLLVFTASAPAVAAKKPPAQYWMSVETSQSSMPGMPSGMGLVGAIMGGEMPGMGSGRSLRLQLGSPEARPASPDAAHDIPPGQKMGKSLPLLVSDRPPPGPEGESSYEKPKGRLLIYWGCGETVRPGQPVVLDMARSSPSQFAKAMAGRTPSGARAPAPGRDRIYADWPNRQNRTTVPKDASLVGPHRIHGNFTPEIRFDIDPRHDFMAPVAFSSVQGSLAEPIRFEWRPVPTALYFASAMGAAQRTGELILWSSSEVQEVGNALMDYLPPSDVQRFVRDKVVMGPGVNRCVIPRGIFKDAEGAMLRFIAYGDELDFAHPPKPRDPKQSWEPIWTAKVRLKSTGMLMLGADMEAGDLGGSISGGQGTTPGPKSPAQGAAETVNKIKGLLGF